MSTFTESIAEEIALYIAILKDAKRDYRSALKYIQRRERFLAKQVEPLGYGSEKLFVAEAFTYPLADVKYNGGLTWFCAKQYIVYFAKDDTGWHFHVAPTERAPEGGTLIMDERARRLIDCPAGMVMRCAATIDKDVRNILDLVASVVSASSFSAPKADKVPAKRKGLKNGAKSPNENLH
jgi:hypothetical protein